MEADFKASGRFTHRRWYTTTEVDAITMASSLCIRPLTMEYVQPQVCVSLWVEREGAPGQAVGAGPLIQVSKVAFTWLQAFL